MDREKRGALAFGIILGLIILGSVFLFLWGTYLDRGTILISGDAPFQVLTIDGKTTFCETSPCKLVQKSGLKDLILTKEGYRSVSTEVVVKLWKSVDLKVNFEINPYIQQTEVFPEIEEEIIYSIVFDKEKNIYKLVDSQDPQKNAIVFFQKEIASPLIFGSSSAVLIVDTSEENSAYKVDTILFEREKIDNFDFRNIEKGTWSNDGENFAFSLSDSGSVWILNKDNIVSELYIKKENAIYTWAYNGNLLFVTNQNTETGEVTSIYSFVEYNPLTSSYQNIGTFSEVISLPNLLIPANNGGIIYFQIGDIKYRLILRKF